MTTGDAFFCNKRCALGRGRSQSIVALENVNGTSLKGTNESDYRITGVEAEREHRGYLLERVLEIAARTMSCKILTGVNYISLLADTSRESHKELEDMHTRGHSPTRSRVNRVLLATINTYNRSTKSTRSIQNVYNLNKHLLYIYSLPLDAYRTF